MIDVRDQANDRIGQEAEKAGNWINKLEDSAADVVDVVKEKVHDAAAGASEFVDKAKETSQEWAAAATCAAGQAKDKMQEAAFMAAGKAEEIGEEMTSLIRRYPIQALLIGFGVGFLFAQTMRRS